MKVFLLFNLVNQFDSILARCLLLVSDPHHHHHNLNLLLRSCPNIHDYLRRWWGETMLTVLVQCNRGVSRNSSGWIHWVFSGFDEPMDAYDWLHNMKKNIWIACCTEIEKCSSHPTSWRDLQESSGRCSCLPNLLSLRSCGRIFVCFFYCAHIPDIMISLKNREFHAIKQGHRTMKEYQGYFDRLPRYTPTDVGWQGQAEHLH